jgi:pimeloyl-ACP methyl ester carboxylesterase
VKHPTGSRSGYLDLEGGRLYYEVAGNGPPLVLVHAGVADLRMWDAQVPAFAEQYRVIRYDERFAGRSRTREVPFSRRKDLIDLLDDLEAERISLVGCSRGGQLAIDFTLEYPDRVDALIAVAPGISGYVTEPSETEKPIWEEGDRLETAQDWDALVDLEIRAWVDGIGQQSDRVDPAIRERVREMDLPNYVDHPENLAGLSKQLDPPAVARLREIRVPTLAIVGDLDASGVRAAVDTIEREVPGARKVVIPGTAHMLNMERPDEFNRAVLEFLKGIRRRPD